MYIIFGDNMKYKFLVPILFSIAIGLFFGKAFFDIYDSSSVTVFDEKDKIYMLQIGVYETEEQIKSVKNYKNFLSIKEEDGYHLYVGITKSSEIAGQIKELYEKDGYSIYVKESIENNKSFLSVLGEYDKVIGIASSNDIKEIEKIVLSNYKEMVLEDES